MDIARRISNLKVSDAISPDDKMSSPDHHRHYFYVGKSNLLAILNLMNVRLSYPGGDAPIKDIFDLGCGHGRGVRWVRAAFPEASIDVTDYDKTGVEWCVQNFGCRDTAGEVAADKYDLVWLSSVFTHLPPHIAEPLLKDLLASLRPNGVLGFTTQGRYSVERMKNFDWESDTHPWLHYNLDEERFRTVIDGYNGSGYGYVDYPRQKDYGVCIARPEWYSARALVGNDIIQISFQERGADNHQDVIAFMRSSLVDVSKGPLW